IDAAGPNFGNEVLLDTLADSADVATLIAARDRYLWPVHYDLRRIPIVNPTLAYPISLLMRATGAHPALSGIVDHLSALTPLAVGAWRPSWAPAPRGVDGTVAYRSPTDRPPRSVGTP
ncbi:LysR family transcriptional regulator, partial [Rhodococcus hoagii]|nr:LysR family transcriptional regulator [Prescottella equi]